MSLSIFGFSMTIFLSYVIKKQNTIAPVTGPEDWGVWYDM